MFSFMWFLISSAVIAVMLLVSVAVSAALAWAWGWIDDQDEVNVMRFGVFRILCRKAFGLRPYSMRGNSADVAINEVTKRPSLYVRHVTSSQKKALLKKGVPEHYFRDETLVLNVPLLLWAIASPIIFWLVVTFWLPAAVISISYALAQLARGARRLSKRLKLHEADPNAHKKVASDEA